MPVPRTNADGRCKKLVNALSEETSYCPPRIYTAFERRVVSQPILLRFWIEWHHAPASTLLGGAEISSLTGCPPNRSDSSAASRMRTTRKPTSPLQIGLVFPRIVSTTFSASNSNASLLSSRGEYISPARYCTRSR